MSSDSANLDRPLWVSCSHSDAFWPNGGFRAPSGCSPWLNGSFSQYRTFKRLEKGQFERQLTASSGRFTLHSHHLADSLANSGVNTSTDRTTCRKDARPIYPQNAVFQPLISASPITPRRLYLHADSNKVLANFITENQERQNNRDDTNQLQFVFD